MEATVLRDVPEDSRMATEEVFGPALPIFIVKDLDDAIAKANASVYGLGSSIWTKDLAKARKAAELLEAGYTWINDIQVAYDQLPFGGTKQSGFGKEHGIEGLDGYLEKKSVVLAYWSSIHGRSSPRQRPWVSSRRKGPSRCTARTATRVSTRAAI